MAEAPFLDEIADAPPGAQALWLGTRDGLRIRTVFWHGGDRGTVLLFPGRTEYIEKYGRIAGELTRRGLNVVVTDWRGQGLSDRVEGAERGHVIRFSDYQNDVAAVLEEPRIKALPGPRLLLAHSMGGCIGLSALLDGLDVRAAIFTAPMWGIAANPVASWAARLLAAAASRIGLRRAPVPGTAAASYAGTEPFATNTLTNDRATYEWMQSHLALHPELGLGGPTLGWLDQALREMVRYRSEPLPDLPVLVFLGSEESIVDPSAVERVTARLPQGRLIPCPGAKHEILMERAETLALFWDEFDRFIADHL